MRMDFTTPQLAAAQQELILAGVVLAGCAVRHTGGGYAVWADAGSRHVELQGLEVTDAGSRKIFRSLIWSHLRRFRRKRTFTVCFLLCFVLRCLLFLLI